MSAHRRTAALALVAAVVLSGCSQTGQEVAGERGSQTSQQAAGAPTAGASGGGRSERAKPAGARQSKPKAHPKPTAAAPDPAADPAAVELARTPRQLARILMVAEAAIRDPAVGGTQLAQAAHTQQLVYRRLARSSAGPRARTFRHLPVGLRPAARANVRAGAALLALTTPQPKLPDWRIVRPERPARLLRHYRVAADRFGLEWEYLAAINLVETRMGRIRGRSTAGAQGPMQFMPATWDAYGRGDINDPRDAIEAAARYLAASGAPQDMDGALYSYNHSDRYVEAVSSYAGVIRDDPRAFRGYYHWQVYYLTPDGDVHLPEGYGY